MIKSDLISLEDKNKEKEYKHKGKIINDEPTAQPPNLNNFNF